MTNSDFWKHIDTIIARDFDADRLKQLEQYAELFIAGRLVYKRFSPLEQHGCAEGGSNHVIASLLAGAGIDPSSLSAPEGSFQRECECAETLHRNMSASMTHNDAINMLMVEGKAAIKAVLDGLLQTGDNAACEDIINDAKNEVDYFSWDYNKTVEENLTDLETAVNDIITRAKTALVTARTTTGNEEVEDQDNSQKSKVESRKVIRNGRLLILRGGKTYNAVGAEVQ